ncbi:MAG: STAS domain-containing protein [Melioribacteraceae bacterium]|jgi:anti-sigma B factor antagonist|nr:STAS domain-containing protein [Melioribacteraceae bacterium]
MPILTETIDGVSVILVDLERATNTVAESFKYNINFELAADSNKFIFDLSKCEFIDSTFLSALVISYKRIAEAGGKLRIVGLKPAVESMFQLTRLNKIFDVFADEKEALKSLG